jgi:CelD/BcsL family acetyltransferase involved in cellulose biosynthesis
VSAADGASRTISTDDPRWLDFVRGRPQARPYHHPAWARTISETYGFEPFVLALSAADGSLSAGIPFVPVGGRLRPKRWVALPFTDVLEPLWSNGTGAAELAPIVESAAREAGVSSIEIRGPLSAPAAHEATRGVEHTLALTDPETLLAGFQSQVRRNIRKADKSGVTIRVADDPRDLTHWYFDLHAETRRRLGVPTQPRRLFEEVWTHMIEPGLGFVLLACHEGRPVAGAVFLEWNGRVVYKFGASAQRFWPLRPNNLIIWEAIRRGCERGARELDFGRSDLEDEGLRAFKASWGAVELPLVYTTLGRRPESKGQTAERLLRPVLRRAPIWFGRRLGAALYRFAA